MNILCPKTRLYKLNLFFEYHTKNKRIFQDHGVAPSRSVSLPIRRVLNSTSSSKPLSITPYCLRTILQRSSVLRCVNCYKFKLCFKFCTITGISRFSVSFPRYFRLIPLSIFSCYLCSVFFPFLSFCVSLSLFFFFIFHFFARPITQHQ